MKLFVGNIDWGVTETKLTEFAEAWGVPVLNVIFREGKQGGRFAFLRTTDAAPSDSATRLNGKMLGGRTLKVNLATR